MYDVDKTFNTLNTGCWPRSWTVGKNIALVFDQPSTRTDMSFRLACHKIGAIPDPKPMGMTSMEKGETLTHTFLALADMGYDAIVYRGFGEYEDPPIPVINAGSKGEHPTQSLINIYTAEKHCGKGPLNIVMSGDIGSRAATSDVNMFSGRGHRCYFVRGWQLPSTSVLIVYRNQDGTPCTDPITYIPGGTYLMAPGPVIDEIDHSLFNHARCLIRQQVQYSVDVRAAVLINALR